MHDYDVSVSLKKHHASVAGPPATYRKGLVEHKSGGHNAKGKTTPSVLADLAFVQFPVCEYSPAEKPPADSLPSGTISFFASETCPTNWESFEEAQGRFIMAQQGDQVGRVSSTSWISDNVLTYPELGAHDHRILTSITVKNISLDSGTVSYCTAHSGTYSVTGKAKPTKALDPVMPFVPLLACKRKKTPFDEAAQPSIPTYMIAFFDEPNCPNDSWQRLDSVAHRFFVGAPSDSAQTGLAGGGKAVGPDASDQLIYTHDHSVSGRIELGTCEHHMYGFDGTTFGKYKDYSKHRSYPYSATSKAHATDPWPYIELTACQYLDE